MSTSDDSFYVYALKDPRTSPALPFYVGKGTGTRSHDHLLRPDATRKGKRIAEISAAGAKARHIVLLVMLSSRRFSPWKREAVVRPRLTLAEPAARRRAAPDLVKRARFIAQHSLEPRSIETIGLMRRLLCPHYSFRTL